MEAAEGFANYFNTISNEYEPLEENQIPKTFSSPLPTLTVEQVKKIITTGKKPKSRVDGDIFVDILIERLDVLGPVICDVFNKAIQTATWPEPWKVEYVTVLPKVRSPEGPNQCRNISCTNYLSKVLERVILGWAQENTNPKLNQYGGQKGCSTAHFLMEMWDQITECLEDSRAASVMTSIDYSKAYNRLEHKACLQSFARLGAPTEIIAILAAFLKGRRMTVKINEVFSAMRTVNAGAPRAQSWGLMSSTSGLTNWKKITLTRVTTCLIHTILMKTTWHFLTRDQMTTMPTQRQRKSSFRMMLTSPRLEKSTINRSTSSPMWQTYQTNQGGRGSDRHGEREI